MKPTKDEIKQYTTQALQRCLESYPRLGDKEWGKKASDQWTAKDYLAHLVITQEEEANRLIQQALAGDPTSIPGFATREGINDFNEQMLAKVRDLPVSDLLSRLKATFEETLGVLEGLSEADLDKPASHPAWGIPGTVRDLLFASYLHLPSHYQDIRRAAKKKLPHWVEASTAEEVHFQMERTFNYMPLIYWSDRGGDMKATYLFTMEGKGAGQWAVHIAEGKAEAQCGAPESFDIEVRTKPDLWIDLSNNDLNPMWAITTRKVHLGGNQGLAMKLGTLFQLNE
jgi:hypothetical protein